MNQSTQSITSWLDHLQVLTPPKSITLIGAGNGQGTLAQWLLQQAHAPHITLVEADARQFASLQRTVAEHGSAKQFTLLNEVVAPQDGMASFFVASSTAESGLLQPEALRAIWPNLQTVEVQECQAVGLKEFLGLHLQAAHADNALPAPVESAINSQWLILDCLTAGSMLDKVADKLALVDVLIVRVLLDTEESAKAAQIPQASTNFVKSMLRGQGLAQAAIETTRHPAIGYVLFVRDVRTALNNQGKKHQDEQQQAEQKFMQLALTHATTERLSAESQTQAQEYAQQAAKLGKACDEQARLAQERQAQIEQLTQAKATAEKQAQEQAQLAAQLGKARNEQSKALPPKLKFGSEANIDDFINDIAPFFITTPSLT